MKYLKAILLVLFVCSFSMAVAGRKGKPVQQKVYIYGFSASFVDSVAYLTDVMELDSATILSNGFLAERQLYSMQLESYVLEQFKLTSSTNAVFFSKKRKDLETKHEKMSRRYQRSANLALIYLSEDDFKFHAEEHIEAVEIEETDEQTASDAAGNTSAASNASSAAGKDKKASGKKSSNKKAKSKK